MFALMAEDASKKKKRSADGECWAYACLCPLFYVVLGP
jgi:hypothetical protein